MLVIGLISGTSTDGIDAALVDIKGKGINSKVRLIEFKTYSYPKGVKERIVKASKQGNVRTICHLNFYLGELFAKAAIGIARRAGYSLGDIDLIGSHGQTVQHLPKPKREGEYMIRSTLQIGEPSVIAERTGVTTVADFRPRDISAGGEGAPLTPYFHYVLFKDPKKSRIVVNIGGISNITYIPAGKGLEEIIAFDTGPGNMIIDGVVERLSNKRLHMDKGGRMASKGRIHEGLLERLMSHTFINRRPPKTTGREVFGFPMVGRVVRMAKTMKVSAPDLVTTATAFTAFSIAYNIQRFITPEGFIHEIIVGGGGVKNPVLMRMLRILLRPIPVLTFEDFGLSSKAIEAMAFALLAKETIEGNPNNVPAATGATRHVVTGKIVKGD